MLTYVCQSVRLHPALKQLDVLPPRIWSDFHLILLLVQVSNVLCSFVLEQHIVHDRGVKYLLDFRPGICSIVSPLLLDGNEFVCISVYPAGTILYVRCFMECLHHLMNWNGLQTRIASPSLYAFILEYHWVPPLQLKHYGASNDSV
jgi:hypothetical protein